MKKHLNPAQHQAFKRLWPTAKAGIDRQLFAKRAEYQKEVDYQRYRLILKIKGRR